MNLLEFAVLAVTGFVASAEFGSYAFVHPVIRRLPPEHHITVEQGLLRTFGRFMPVAMTACPVLTAAYATAPGSSAQSTLRWASVAAFALALMATIAVNVGINASTGRWDSKKPPADWKGRRRRWELFQSIRSWLLLAGFLGWRATSGGDAGRAGSTAGSGTLRPTSARGWPWPPRSDPQP